MRLRWWGRGVGDGLEWAGLGNVGSCAIRADANENGDWVDRGWRWELGQGR